MLREECGTNQPPCSLLSSSLWRAVSGSYTADYTDSDRAAGGESVEEKRAREKRHGSDGGGGSSGVGAAVRYAVVLLVGVAMGGCAARAYSGYKRRGQYQPIDRV